MRYIRTPLTPAFHAQLFALGMMAAHGYAPSFFATPREWCELEALGYVVPDGDRYVLPPVVNKPLKLAA